MQYYSRNPVTATFTGVHEHDARLPDWTSHGRAQEQDELRGLADRLKESGAIEALEAMQVTDRLRRAPETLDATLALANVTLRIAELDSAFFQQKNPALWTGEAIFGPVSLMNRSFGASENQMVTLTARLAAVPEFLANLQLELLQPVPAEWCARAIRECAAAQQLFHDGIREWCDARAARADPERGSLLAAARSACTAFAHTKAWLETLPLAAETAYACGQDMFSVLLQQGHFCDQSTEMLLERAEQEMEVERAVLDTLLAPYGGKWSAAQTAMAREVVTPENFLRTFDEKWREIRDAMIEHDVLTWPQWPIRYVALPLWAREAAPQLYWLHYRSPAPFDRYDVHDYIVTPIDSTVPAPEQATRLAAWNRSVITLNHVVHHGGMGHHVQNWHALYRSPSRVGKVAAVDAASRIGMFLGGSMAEGWAGYATHLAEELGLLSPLERLSEQHTRVRLLARAIVDIRLHTGSWTRNECTAYYVRIAGLSEAAALNETNKNSMFPATAIMYWLGLTAILDARETERAHYGSRFSLKQFHDGLLSRGAIPVLLAARLKENAHE